VTDYAPIDAPDQATLDTVVQALYEDGQRVLKKLKMRVPLMPHDHMDKVIVQWTSAHPWYVDGNGVYIVYGYTFPCVPGAQMELSLELAPFSPAIPAAAAEGYTTVSTNPGAPLGLSVGAASYGFGGEYAGVVGTGAYQFTAANSGLGSEAVLVEEGGKRVVVATDSGAGTHTAVKT
jgi:hypothetical protein